MDPQLTSDGQPYAPLRYQELVKQRYIISNRCNTSYIEVGEMTPTERNLILGYIQDEIRKENQIVKDTQKLGR